MLQYTCLRPLWVRAEHSMYLTARILLANLIPCSRFTGDRPWEASCPIASLFSRRSILVPTINVATLAIMLTSCTLLHHGWNQNLYFNVLANKIMWFECKLSKWKLKGTKYYLHKKNKTFFYVTILQCFRRKMTFVGLFASVHSLQLEESDTT